MKITQKWFFIGSSLVGSALFLSALWLFAGHFRFGGALVNGHGLVEDAFAYAGGLPNLPFGWLAIAGVILLVAAGGIAFSSYDATQSKTDESMLCPECGLELDRHSAECSYCGAELPRSARP